MSAMTAEQFQARLQQNVADCEEIIGRFLPKEEGYTAGLMEAMNYSVLAGGKRLRPMFIYETAKMYGAPAALYEPFMAALEMIHTYSLIHDDLPAMDNDMYRRGRKTTWAVYGEGIAIVAGDGLLNFAYETAMKAFAGAASAAEQERIIAALGLLMKNAGAYGMVGGQYVDLKTEEETKAKKEAGLTGTVALNDDERRAEEDKLAFIHKNKTAALIDSGLTIGAILGGAPKEDIDNLHLAADKVGLAFQIQDDILDVIGDQAALGKSIGKDAEEGKCTYVSLFGLEGAKERAAKLTAEALAALDALSVESPFLRALVRSLLERNH